MGRQIKFACKVIFISPISKTEIIWFAVLNQNFPESALDEKLYYEATKRVNKLLGYPNGKLIYLHDFSKIKETFNENP